MDSTRTVIVADDDVDIRECLGQLFRDEGLDVREAADGRRALAWLTELGDDRCVLVLDLMMPTMSGFEVLEILQREDRLGRVPVVVCSAFHRGVDLPHGVFATITKPIVFDVLYGAIARACAASRNSEVRRVGPQSGVTRVHDTPAPEAPSLLRSTRR